MAAAALKFAAAVLLAALCAAALAPPASGAEALARCIERCGCVPCPEGRICPAVCTTPPDCKTKCQCADSAARCQAGCYPGDSFCTRRCSARQQVCEGKR